MRFGAGVVGRLSAHVRTPLHRDAYALALSSGSTAAAGLVYWIVAAAEYPPHALGLNAALISSMMFLAGVASLNLTNILVRFLPEAGVRTTRLVAYSYATAGGLALLAAVVFLAGVEAWAPRLGFLRGEPALQLWFALSTVAWCVFAIQDSVLTALRRAVWVPVENTAFSLLKLGLLVALAGWFPLYGIFVSWTIAMVAAVAVVNVLVFGRLTRRMVARPAGAAVRLRDRAFARYFAADYLCSVAWLSAANLMPVIVTAEAGATTNAYYALAWAVALPLYALAANIGTSLVLHATLDPGALPALTRKAARQGAQLLVPVVAGVVLLAPVLLSLFGGDYAERSAALLRLLAAAAIPYLVLVLALSAARVRRRLRPAVLAMGSQAVLALGLVTPLLDRFGVKGAGIAWLTSQVVPAAAVLVVHRRRRVRAPAGAAPGPAEAPPDTGAISVVVPTRDRPDVLTDCLDSVLAGDRAPDEVIVVDNAPERPATAGLLRTRYGGDPRVRRIALTRPNAARARGVALDAARGEVVAFVDDDVVVDRRWLAEIASAFAVTDDVGAVTTRILPSELETPAQRWLEQFGGFSKGSQRRVFDLREHRPPDPIYPYSPGVYGSGASMAFRTRLLRELGGLDPRLSFGGEDLDLFLKIVLAGHRLVYEPRAIAWHRHPREYAALRRTMFRYGAGLTALMTKWSLSDARVARDIAVRIPGAVRLALAPGSRKNAGKRPGYPRELTRLERAGMLAGPFMFARSCWRERRHDGR